MITPLRPTNYAVLAPHRLPRRRRRSTPPTAFSGTIFRLRPRLEVMEDRTLLSTFLVSNTGDSGPGSLRQAILDSNNAAGATNAIDFDISSSGVQTIVPLSSLPAITNPRASRPNSRCSTPGAKCSSRAAASRRQSRRRDRPATCGRDLLPQDAEHGRHGGLCLDGHSHAGVPAIPGNPEAVAL